MRNKIRTEEDFFNESKRLRAEALILADTLKDHPLRFKIVNEIEMEVEITKSDLKTIVSKNTQDNRFNAFKNKLAQDIRGFLEKAEEKSLVCPISLVPGNTIEREDGWRAFRIEGVLDFSLIGILSKISSLLAANKIGIFAISTFNTDYILTKKEDFDKAIDVLKAEGYLVK